MRKTVSKQFLGMTLPTKLVGTPNGSAPNFKYIQVNTSGSDSCSPVVWGALWWGEGRRGRVSLGFTIEIKSNFEWEFLL